MSDAWSAMIATLKGSPVDARLLRHLDRFVVATHRHLTPEAFGDAGVRDLTSAAVWRSLAAEVQP